MTDDTEHFRRNRLIEINAAPGSREASKPNMAKSGIRNSFLKISR